MAALGGTPCQGATSAAARCSGSGSQRPCTRMGWPLPAGNGPWAAPQRWQRKRDPRCSAASDALSLGLSSRASVQLQSAPEQQRVVPRRSWGSMTDAEDDALDDAAPPPPPRAAQSPLKINTDLRLYRARLARMMANLAADSNERRRLLRESEAGLRLCLDTDPTDPRAYVSLGRILLQQKRYDEARKLYADGTANTGNTNPYIWAAWGYLEYKAGDVSRARKLFDAAIVVDETHAAAWHKWGMLEMRQGNFMRARDLWTRGIQKCRRAPQKSNTYLYCSLAVMAAELGKLGEARSWFEEGTRTNLGKGSCALWHAWATVEARIGDPAAVRFLFKRSLQANPASRYAYLAWAMWERRLGNAAACAQLLARGQALNPADPALFQARGMVAKEAGGFDEAAATFAAGIKVDPSHLYLWQAWGVMEFQRGRLEEARRLFQEGVWADPGNRDVVYVFQAWGVLEWKGTQNHQLARELFKAALKVDPRNESTWGTWIAMEEELGRLEAANDLRIRRGEQQWEFVIPSSFTTRPPGGGGGEEEGSGEGGGAAAAGAPALGPLNSILTTINRFFRARGEGFGRAGGGGGGGGARSLADMLPADFLKEGDSAGVAGLAAELLAGGAPAAFSDGGAAAAAAAPAGGEQQQQQQHGEQQPEAHEQHAAAAPHQQQQRRRAPRQQQQQQRQQRVTFPDGSQGAQRSAVSRLTKRPTRPAAPQPGGVGGGDGSSGGAAAGLAAAGSSSSSSDNGSSSANGSISANGSGGPGV
ncbi:mRNA maturation factor [Raphidocelis subcapitata]|uniref:mRNA maturation factor n=1 Tax=Raphidocelis subcapitata TaxID=307507 RepID=A0A2V0PMD9_9CHLO|nr:mRNA maturation factor [Raphidocelis subcapitata]|eukprot:GBF99253.1 mRNA maturation factor [Raphidocelis subcapitata]